MRISFSWHAPLRLVNSLNRREHWAKRAKRTKIERRVAMQMTKAAVPGEWRASLPQVVVTITRIAPRRLDDDGAVASAKGTRDGIADALRVNDNDPRVEWVVKQGRGKPREYGVLVSIEEKATAT